MLAETETEARFNSQPPEYSAPLEQNRSAPRHGRAAVSHRWLRLLYFCIASVWGFLCGAIGLAIVLPGRGYPSGFQGPLVLLLLIPAIVVAILGGAVSAAAYREARRRAAR
jgi:hypothetical protein